MTIYRFWETNEKPIIPLDLLNEGRLKYYVINHYVPERYCKHNLNFLIAMKSGSSLQNMKIGAF